MSQTFNAEDISQIIVGAFALSVPVSFSEEAWRMGENLPSANLALVVILSVAFLAFYAYQGVFQGDVRSRLIIYLLRIVLAYLITLVVVGLVLAALDKLPFLENPALAVKRILVISMPASMGAIIVDSLDKGILVYRNERRSLVFPCRLLHRVKRLFEWLYLRRYRRA